MASSSNSSSATATLTEEAVREVVTETLKLKLKKTDKGKKIKWTEDTVDNEGLGKKKSKCCCQYKKPRAGLDDSSDDSEDECGDCPGHAGQ